MCMRLLGSLASAIARRSSPRSRHSELRSWQRHRIYERGRCGLPAAAAELLTAPTSANVRRPRAGLAHAPMASDARHGPREHARYGHRALRVGEASHPGPAVTRFSVRIQLEGGAWTSLGGKEDRPGFFSWRTGARPSLCGPRRPCPKAALEAWLGVFEDAVALASLVVLRAWEEQPTQAQMDGVELATGLVDELPCSPQLDPSRGSLLSWICSARTPARRAQSWW